MRHSLKKSYIEVFCGSKTLQYCFLCCASPLLTYWYKKKCSFTCKLSVISSMKYVLTSSQDLKKILFLCAFILITYYRDTCPWPIISKLFQSKTSHMILKSHEARKTFWWKNLWTNKILSGTLFFHKERTTVVHIIAFCLKQLLCITAY